MSAILNLAALTFTADQLRSMNELVVKAVLEAPIMSEFHSFTPGIKNDREIGIIPGTLGLIGKAAQGCNPVADSLTLAATLKKWEPKRIEMILDQCATDLETSMLKLTRKLGIEVNDLTQTEYFAFLLDLLSRDIPKMIFRHAWFGNKSAANIHASPAGVITTGIDVAYFNVINGFFYQLAEIYAADSARKTAISGNSQATRALQFSVLTAQAAFDDVNTVMDSADPILVSQPDKILLMTRSVNMKLRRYLQTKGIVYNINYATGGFEIGEWDGVKAITIPIWDEMIQAYENNGTKLNNPHRVVYTTVSNLNIGMEGTSLFDNVNVFYDKKSRINRLEASDAFDAKVLVDNLVQVGL